MTSRNEIDRRRAEREAFHAATPAGRALILALHVKAQGRPWPAPTPALSKARTR